MRKILILLPLFLISCAGRNNVEISGTISEDEGSGLYLQQLEGNRVIDLDSTAIGTGGKFKFSIKLEFPELIILKNDKGEIINLLPSPGERIHIESGQQDFGVNYTVNGSPDSENVRDLVLQLAGTRKSLDSIADLIRNTSENDSEQLQGLQQSYQKKFIDQKRFTIRFIISHIHSPASIYALYQKLYQNTFILNEITDLQYYKFVADSMKVYFPNSSLTITLLEDIEQRENQFKENQDIEKLLSGAQVKNIIDVALPDTKGDTIELTSLQDRVVMIVFWASRDANSIQSLLNLQGIYRRYHPKGFEVYAISLDNDRTRWITSINFNQFDWINVSELSFPDSRIDMQYNVQRLPTTFLVNREGEIVARDLYGRNLEIWLDNLL